MVHHFTGAAMRILKVESGISDLTFQELLSAKGIKMYIEFAASKTGVDTSIQLSSRICYFQYTR